MSGLFDLRLFGNETMEITPEEAENIKESIAAKEDYVMIGQSLIRNSAIMAIVPSKKSHPKYTAWQNFLGTSGSKMSFESYLDQTGYPREAAKALPGGEQ